MVEAALGVAFDTLERVGFDKLEEGARKGSTKNLKWLPDAVRGVRTVSARLPGSSGRAVASAAELVLRTGLATVRDLRLWLEDSRRERTGDDVLFRQASRSRVPRRARRK